MSWNLFVHELNTAVTVVRNNSNSQLPDSSVLELPVFGSVFNWLTHTLEVSHRMHARKTVCFGSKVVSCFGTPMIPTQSVAVSPTASMLYFYGRLLAGPKGPEVRLKATTSSDSQSDCNKTETTRNEVVSLAFGISKKPQIRRLNGRAKSPNPWRHANGRCLYVLPSLDIDDYRGHWTPSLNMNPLRSCLDLKFF